MAKPCIQGITAASGRTTCPLPLCVCSQGSARITTPIQRVDITSAHTHIHTHTSARTPVNASSVTSHDCKAWTVHDQTAKGSVGLARYFSRNITSKAARKSHTQGVTSTQITTQWQQQHHGCAAAPVAGSPRQPCAHTRHHAPPYRQPAPLTLLGSARHTPTETQALPISATVL